MHIRFWGTRGSIPTPGPTTVRYGGNTACVEVRDSTGSLLVLDAGTGLRELGIYLMGANGKRPFTVDLLLSHLHWDHIQGLPFFRPAFVPNSTMRIIGPKQERSMKDLEWTLESLKHTWPKPGDEGMGSLQDAELSERDRAAAKVRDR